MANLNMTGVPPAAFENIDKAVLGTNDNVQTNHIQVSEEHTRNESLPAEWLQALDSVIPANSPNTPMTEEVRA
jgi:hypothetical protein